jgi:hypothetical protein
MATKSTVSCVVTLGSSETAWCSQRNILPPSSGSVCKPSRKPAEVGNTWFCCFLAYPLSASNNISPQCSKNHVHLRSPAAWLQSRQYTSHWFTFTRVCCLLLLVSCLAYSLASKMDTIYIFLRNVGLSPKYIALQFKKSYSYVIA